MSGAHWEQNSYGDDESSARRAAEREEQRKRRQSSEQDCTGETGAADPHDSC